ncbi:hypothetical protein RRF57_001488 [Xylaria bambusicola]|uniref:Uncharacterized protein n=1 Tax=Xylaria bambusicola TaxID=326684 RepID=A0AAN7Z0T4_9PEZI
MVGGKVVGKAVVGTDERVVARSVAIVTALLAVPVGEREQAVPGSNLEAEVFPTSRAKEQMKLLPVRN